MRSLPSLKKAFVAKIEDDLEKQCEEAKEQVMGKKRQTHVHEKKEELRATIGRHYKERETGFDESLWKRRPLYVLETSE